MSDFAHIRYVLARARRGDRRWTLVPGSSVRGALARRRRGFQRVWMLFRRRNWPVNRRGLCWRARLHGLERSGTFVRREKPVFPNPRRVAIAIWKRELQRRIR